MTVTLIRSSGRVTLQVLREMGKMGSFLLTALLSFGFPPFYLAQVMRRIDFIGARSLLLIIFTGAFTGMVVALQGHVALRRFGGEELIGPGVGLIDISREESP